MLKTLGSKRVYKKGFEGGKGGGGVCGCNVQFFLEEELFSRMFLCFNYNHEYIHIMTCK